MKPETETHDFVLCSLPDCKETEEEHCHYQWCGAPRNHPLHVGSKKWADRRDKENEPR